MKIYIIETKATNKTDLLYAISNFAEKNKITTNTNRLLKAFNDREEEFSTAFENGIAIPHARIKEIQESAIIIARNSSGIDWKSLDGKPTDCAIALLIEGNSSAGNEHMEVLARVSGLLLDKANIKLFKTGSLEEVTKLVNKKETKKQVVEDYYDFVAVTSCPTGVAHTNMAAEALERFATQNKLKVKIERQAAQGTVNQITMEDMAKTKHVILAIGRSIEGMERFDGKKLIKVGVAEPMKNAQKLWDTVQTAETYVSSVKSSSSQSTGGSKLGSKMDRVSPMAAVLTGLSYMIPIVIVGGIFLAFGLGIGRAAIGGDVTGPAGEHTFWRAIFSVGVVGIQLAVVVLGAFIAQAIGGRLALAPALIVTAMCQSVGSFSPAQDVFFNYATGELGLTDNANLSFFGAIASGFLFGYAAKYWTIFVSPRLPKWVRTIEPIILVPMLFVFVGWFLFAFLLYVPLYWTSIGMGKGIKWLGENQLFWLVGMIGGGMLCFDLGGPINKIAFGTGVFFITISKVKDPVTNIETLDYSNFHPEVMGAIAAAGSVPPAGMALGWFIGGKVFRIEKFRTDEMLKESFVPALFMALVGISEGAIPYAIKYPKTAIISNVIGGMLAGAISGAFMITDVAAHTGPIVYLLGAIGKGDGTTAKGNGATDYAYGLLYIAAWLAGTALTTGLFIGLEMIGDRRKKAGKPAFGSNFKKSFKKENKSVAQPAGVAKIEKVQPEWKGYAWKALSK